MKISSRWIQRFVGEQGNPRRVLAEHRERVVEVILTVEKGDVRRPEFFGFRAFLLDPFRNLSEDGPTVPPLMQVLGATDRNLPFSSRAIAGAEQVPGRALSNDGRVVDELNVPSRFQGLRRSRWLLSMCDLERKTSYK